MKIDEFLKNAGNKGSIIPGKEQLLINLNYRLELLEKYKKIEMHIYTDKNNVFYHLIIPTENKDRENSYDVIIKFKETEKSDKFDQSYRQYQIEFFSNCPSFTYGYAYVANINGYLIDEFIDKYESQILKYPPVSRNPGLLFSFEKSIYFACRYLMNNKKFLLKSYVDSYSKPLSRDIIKNIRHMNVIEEEYKKADIIMKHNQKKNKLKIDKKTERRKNEMIKNNENKNNVNKISKIKGTNKKINHIKKKR